MTTVAPSGRLGVAGVPVAKVASIGCGIRANIGTIWNTSDPLIATPGMGEGFPHPVWVKRDPPSSSPHSRHPRPVVIPAQSGIHRWPPGRSIRPMPCTGLGPPICDGGRRRIPHLAITNNAIYTGASPKRRCGRVAEGGALLKRYTGKTVSRVRIPPSPPLNSLISRHKTRVLAAARIRPQCPWVGGRTLSDPRPGDRLGAGSRTRGGPKSPIGFLVVPLFAAEARTSVNGIDEN